MVTFDVEITQISWGKDHTAFVTPIGVYTMGSNENGKLGIGQKDISYVSTPHIVKHIQMYECAQVSCGWQHTAAVMKSGDFYIWGSSEYGAIGSSITQNTYSPVKFKFKLGNTTDNEKYQNVWMKSVSCGSHFTCAIDSK